MADLLRAKFRARPEHADCPAGTGDSRIHYGGGESVYWAPHVENSRDWMGWLLRLVRFEFLAAQASIHAQFERMFDSLSILEP